ncbi:pentapeptide repeat-containing protein [Streptomyces longwoodensis]|uniref:pentapeptide repeat-containing protein n=1 Tax=Streptomyces longwoodensis TaxID=68231 RepID=UPI0033C9C03F
MSDADRVVYIAGLQPGADIDHRGTPFTEELLSELLAPLRDPVSGRPCLGCAKFNEAKFSGNATFESTDFRGDADFSMVEIRGDARFEWGDIRGKAAFGGAKIGGNLNFSNVTVDDTAWFIMAEIEGESNFTGMRVKEVDFMLAKLANVAFSTVKIAGSASFAGAKIGGFMDFTGAEIGGPVQFMGAVIGSGASFAHARLDGDFDFTPAEIDGGVHLDWVQVGGNASFRKMKFERTSMFGPLACTGTLDLSEAVFTSAVTIEVAAAKLSCRRTHWASTAALRLRYAAVDLSDAVLEHPMSIAARSRPFTDDFAELAEPGLTDPRVHVQSLRGVDAMHLVLTDVNLSDCHFAGTIHLDQLRLEGRCAFAEAPLGLRRHGWRLVRWTSRQTLAEEQHWRADRGPTPNGWAGAAAGDEIPQPTTLAPVYRQLRKSFEDGKNEPGAADFYYGEMEMRRHDPDIPSVERILLTIYWALSGYGLRASRALGWLVSAMTATVLLMMLWGLPQNDPKAESTGFVTGSSVTLTTNTPDPVNPNGPYGERLSTARFEKSMRIVINSVVFRASGQDLTTAGTYTEMASRLAEPVLLGFAVLAVRGRVKR